MIVNTKLNVGQRAFMLFQNSVKEVEILSISLHVTDQEYTDKRITVQATYRVTFDFNTRMAFGSMISSNDLFSSKQELVDSL